mgnify:CR=1 FL=1
MLTWPPIDFWVVLALGTLAASPAFAGKTLDAIKARGQVICGVNTGLAGFSAADSSGNWSGLDVDMCKAVAGEVDAELEGFCVATPEAREAADTWCRANWGRVMRAYKKACRQ